MDFTPFWVVHCQRHTVFRKKGIFQVIWGLFLRFRNVNFQPCESKGDGSHLEAVENSNVDLHQCLVLPQGRRLPGVQGHFFCNLLHQTPGPALSAPSLSEVFEVVKIYLKKKKKAVNVIHYIITHSVEEQLSYSRTEDMQHWASLSQSGPVRDGQAKLDQSEPV